MKLVWTVTHKCVRPCFIDGATAQEAMEKFSVEKVRGKDSPHSKEYSPGCRTLPNTSNERSVHVHDKLTP